MYFHAARNVRALTSETAFGIHTSSRILRLRAKVKVVCTCVGNGIVACRKRNQSVLIPWGQGERALIVPSTVMVARTRLTCFFAALTITFIVGVNTPLEIVIYVKNRCGPYYAVRVQPCAPGPFGRVSSHLASTRRHLVKALLTPGDNVLVIKPTSSAEL